MISREQYEENEQEENYKKQEMFSIGGFLNKFEKPNKENI